MPAKLVKVFAKTMKTLGKVFNYGIPLYLVLILVFNSMLGAVLIQKYLIEQKLRQLAVVSSEDAFESFDSVIPEEGITLPVKWGDLGVRLVETGVIDREKFLELYKGGPLSGELNQYDKYFDGYVDDYIVVTPDNASFVLNFFWALGLAQESQVLTTTASEYPQVERLAATGGWTLSDTSAMDHYGAHKLVDLSSTQQTLVSEIAKNIYRPCCNNHTAFPDCNHGMAMLGVIELMVSQGYSQKDIYENALTLNSLWFPEAYLTIAKYTQEIQGIAWEFVDAKAVLGKSLSSGSGYREVLAQVEPVNYGSGGGGCGV